jgi:hypothetical protein
VIDSKLVLIGQGVFSRRTLENRPFPLKASIAYTTLPCANALACDRNSVNTYFLILLFIEMLCFYIIKIFYKHPLAEIPVHLFRRDHNAYTEEQRQFATTLHLYGPKAYGIHEKAFATSESKNLVKVRDLINYRMEHI